MRFCTAQSILRHKRQIRVLRAGRGGVTPAAAQAIRPTVRLVAAAARALARLRRGTEGAHGCAEGQFRQGRSRGGRRQGGRLLLGTGGTGDGFRVGGRGDRETEAWGAGAAACAGDGGAEEWRRGVHHGDWVGGLHWCGCVLGIHLLWICIERQPQ